MTCGDSMEAFAFGVVMFALAQMIRAGLDLWYAWCDWEDDL